MQNKLYFDERYIANVFVANSFLTRFLGYMGRKKPHHEAILITPCNSIHCFFMRFDIDVLFVDRDFVVLKKVEAMKPGRVVLPINGAASVLETPAGGFRDIYEGVRLSLKSE